MPRSFLLGLILMLSSAAAFGTSGALAKGMMTAGWSPAAVVTLRVAVGALALAVPAALAMRGRWHLLRRSWPSVVLYGLLAVAGTQLAYFLAVERLSVAVALLLEFLGVVLVVLWLWISRGQRPRPLTVLGAALAIAGLLFVLDVFGAIELDPIGVAWGLVAAVGLASYFVLSADQRHGLPALALAAGGLGIGTVVLTLAGAAGVVPLAWNAGLVEFAGSMVPWWVGIAALGLVAAAFAYVAGVLGSRHLGPRLASFVGLSEVLFAVLLAWLLLGEVPAAVQLLGGVLIMAGVVLVRLDDRAEPVQAPVPPPGPHPPTEAGERSAS